MAAWTAIIDLPKKINLMFPLVSGRKGKPTGLYAGGRMAFLIDKQGIVQMIVKGIPENSDILEKIKQLKKYIPPK